MIGLFIGSFNPPTQAHLKISLKLLKKLDKIVFIPVNSKEKELISIYDRLSMLDILKRKNDRLVVDDIMKNYSYLNYRIIDLLKNKYKNVSLIMGSDLLDKFDSFDNYEYLLQNYNFIIIERDGYISSSIIQKKYAKYKSKFSIINYQSDISSTKAREAIKDNKSIKNILDKDVFEYIRKHDLY